jgi:hypothetical protein
MGSFVDNGQNDLFVADTGDNGLRRSSYKIYWLSEPADLRDKAPARTLAFHYEDGPHDCEAVAYDSQRHEFLLVEKRIGLTSRVYALPWKVPADDAIPTASANYVARRIGILPIALATGADVSTDGQRLVAVTYGDGYEVRRQADETWQAAIFRGGAVVSMPKRRQGESVCYGLDNQTLYLTSEKRPCPLFSITRAPTLIDVGPQAAP